MKIFRGIMKIFAALAAVAGLIYVLAEYGDIIVDWANRVMSAVTRRFSCIWGDDEAWDEDEWSDEEEIGEETQEAEETPAEAAAESDFEN